MVGSPDWDLLMGQDMSLAARSYFPFTAMLTLSLFSSSNGEEAASSDETDVSTSLISRGANIEGTLDFADVNLRIEGHVHGDISTDRRVVVAEGAEVHGTINAQTVRVAGYMEGHIVATEMLVLSPSAEVHATLEAETLEIQAGADYSGDVPETKPFIPDSANPSLDPSDLASAANGSQDNTAQEPQG
jgi:cytoskeletal protein CcmA (bactofilin family)